MNTSVTERKQSTDSERDFTFHYNQNQWVLTVVFISVDPHAKIGDSNLALGDRTG